jgi:hypothetical protein
LWELHPYGSCCRTAHGPSPLGDGGLNSCLLPGEKVLRYEADEGFLGLRLVFRHVYGAVFAWSSNAGALIGGVVAQALLPVSSVWNASTLITGKACPEIAEGSDTTCRP